MDLHRVLNGMFYVHKIGCQWRMMSTHSGTARTIDGYCRHWW